MSSKTQIIPLVTSCIPSYTVSSLLDCACGFGKWACILRTHLPKTSQSYIVGLDLFRSNLAFAKKYGAYDDLVLADIRNLPFKANSFHVILAAEVIEHVDKMDGLCFLKNLEQLSFGRIIVTTPNGYLPENPVVYSSGEVNLFEQHRSVWFVSDFRVLGYTTHAIGLKIRVFSKNRFVCQIVAGFDFLLFPSWVIPNLGKHVVAYKDV